MATRFYSAVQYGSAKANNDADCIYYNATISNNATSDTVGSTPDPQVLFNEVRQSPILQNSSEYMMSVINFVSNGATQNLPLWIPQIQVSSERAVFNAAINTSTQIMTVASCQGFISPGDAIFQSGNNTYWLVASQLSPPSPLGGAGTYSITPAGGGSPSSFNSNLTEYLTTVTPQNNPNLTTYSITLEDAGGAFSQVYLQWAPVNTYAITPLTPVTAQNISTDYYYSYSFKDMVTMINAACVTAGTALSVAPPVFALDTDGKLPRFSVGSIAAGSTLYLNTALSSLLYGFDGVYTNQINGKYFRFSANEAQTYCSATTWSPVESLCISSSLLPIVQEQFPAPSIVGVSSQNTLGQLTTGSFLPVASEVTVDLSQDAYAWLRYIKNVPTGEYLMVSLTGNEAPIQNIDFSVWWRCRLDNKLYPLRLQEASAIHLKVLFRRKQLGV